MNQKRKETKVVQSFRYAYEGIIYVLSTQRNMRVHFIIALIALVLSLLLGIPKYQLLFVFSSIVLVICMELVNTAVEKTVDLITDQYHSFAKIAKDVAAGAVLFSALFAFLIGVYVFLPALLALFSVNIPFSTESMVVILMISVLSIFFLRIKKKENT